MIDQRLPWEHVSPKLPHLEPSKPLPDPPNPHRPSQNPPPPRGPLAKG